MIEAFGTTFQNPILLAAGTAGFGIELVDTVQLDQLGGLVTKAVSPKPRIGNPAPRVGEFTGGMVNSVGLANPGLAHVMEHELPWLERHAGQMRILVNVVGDTVEDYATVVKGLSGFSCITAFELNVSCPNTHRGGQEFGADPDVLRRLVAGCRAVTEVPLVVKLSPNVDDLESTVNGALGEGADGFSAVNTWLTHPGDEPGGDAANRLGAKRGGMSGPALTPYGLEMVGEVRKLTSVPIIGLGGIRSVEDAKAYIEAGANLVAIGTAALADPRLPERLAKELSI